VFFFRRQIVAPAKSDWEDEPGRPREWGGDAEDFTDRIIV